MIDKTGVYEFEGFRLDVKKQRLYRNNEVISLPPKAVELLTLMVESQGQILEKEDLIETLWQDTFVEEANLTQTIYILRKALGKNEDGSVPIATLPKRGYKFVPAVHYIPAEETTQTIEKTTTEKIIFSREETERITTAVSKSVENPIISQPITLPAVKKDSFFGRNKYLLPLLLIGLLLGFTGFFAWRGKSTDTNNNKIKTLVVVPFTMISTDDKKEYLGLGLTDTLITRLGKTGKINVRSTEEIQRYSNAEKNPLELGRKLNADAVLTGAIQQIGDRARLNVQLLSVNDGRIIWSNQFDEDATDLFALQDTTTRELTAALTLQLSDAEQRDINQNPTENLDALKLYWQGRFYWNRRTPEWIQKGIQCFEEAIHLDPSFAKAYAGLADSYALTSSGIPPSTRLPKALAAAQRALELDENLAEAHASLAIVTYKLIWDWNGAEAHFKRAIELNDSYATAHHWYGEFLVLMGRYDEGFRELARAEALDPLSIAIKTDIAEALYRARRYDEAIAQTGKVLELDPNNIQIYRIIRRIREQTSKDEAEVVKIDLQIQRLSKLSPQQLSQLEKLYADQNWKEYWKMRLAIVSEAKVIPYFIEKAEIYLQLGDNQAAAEQMTKQINNHELTPILLKGEPLFDVLHSNKQFQLLLQLGGFNPKS